LTTRNGGLYRIAALRLQNDAVSTEDAAMGSVIIPVEQIREIRKL
jgi:hypothetical protein